MRTLDAQRALQAWERGQRRGVQGKALALLAAAVPELSWQQLAELPIGQRDALLCRLRQKTFGSEVYGSARCPRCQASLQFPVDLRNFDSAASLETPRAPEWLAAKGHKVLFRLPTSEDLAAVAEYCLDVGSAREMLIDRCVLQALHHGREVKPRELPEDLIERLGARMEELDPMAEQRLAIHCARCGHKWQVLLDIGHLMWNEIAAAAQRLLHEIHTLATAYGWTEEEVLKLSAVRRKFYILQIRPGKRKEPVKGRG